MRAARWSNKKINGIFHAKRKERYIDAAAVTVHDEKSAPGDWWPCSRLDRACTHSSLGLSDFQPPVIVSKRHSFGASVAFIHVLCLDDQHEIQRFTGCAGAFDGRFHSCRPCTPLQPNLSRALADTVDILLIPIAKPDSFMS